MKEHDAPEAVGNITSGQLSDLCLLLGFDPHEVIELSLAFDARLLPWSVTGSTLCVERDVDGTPLREENGVMRRRWRTFELLVADFNGIIDGDG